VVAAIPFREQFMGLGEGFDPARFGHYWAAFAQRQGVPMVDLYPAFAQHPDPMSLYWIEDIHCTQAGYELIGEKVAELIWSHRSELGLDEEKDPPRTEPGRQ
jgi:hypothetical protein